MKKLAILIALIAATAATTTFPLPVKAASKAMCCGCCSGGACGCDQCSCCDCTQCSTCK